MLLGVSHNYQDQESSSGSRGGRGGHAPPGPVKIGHKKDGRIDFMFLGHPLTRPLDPLLGKINLFEELLTET